MVDRGGTLDGTDVIEPSPHGVPVDLGALGDGQIVFTPQGASVEVEQPGGRFVRVSGTLPVRELVALARSLREVEGSQLVPTGEPW